MREVAAAACMGELPPSTYAYSCPAIIKLDYGYTFSGSVSNFGAMCVCVCVCVYIRVEPCSSECTHA